MQLDKVKILDVLMSLVPSEEEVKSDAFKLGYSLAVADVIDRVRMGRMTSYDAAQLASKPTPDMQSSDVIDKEAAADVLEAMIPDADVLAGNVREEGRKSALLTVLSRIEDGSLDAEPTPPEPSKTPEEKLLE